MAKYIYCILLVFIISGCSFSTQKAKKVYTQKEYDIIKQREGFVQRVDAFFTHKMSKDVFSNYINLPTLSKKMMFIIPTDGLIDKVHYVFNSENDKINIKFHLIDRMEYFYDGVNEELLIVYDLPFSYFLQNNLVYDLNIVGSLDGEIVKNNIRFYFTYHFMKQPKYFNEGTNNPSFEFTRFDDKDLSEDIKSILKEERKKINTKKFSNKYKALYERVAK